MSMNNEYENGKKGNAIITADIYSVFKKKQYAKEGDIVEIFAKYGHVYIVKKTELFPVHEKFIRTY
jgi:hypothetical protein